MSLLTQLFAFTFFGIFLTESHAQKPLHKIQRGVRTKVQNSMWYHDAFPRMPSLLPGKSITIGHFKSPDGKGGRITEMHIVLWVVQEGLREQLHKEELLREDLLLALYDSREDMHRKVALAITYDDLPYPSVFVPVGDFFIEHEVGNYSQNGTKSGTITSSQYDNMVVANRKTFSWWLHAPLPYRKSVKIELFSAMNDIVEGSNMVTHENSPFEEDDGYFHAHFSANPMHKFPWQPVPVVQAMGPGQLIGLSFVFRSTDPGKFGWPYNPSVTHFCEGNWEFYLDNGTQRLYGNDSSTDVARAGYQSSDHVVVWTGTEDLFGYSFGWTQNTAGWLAGTTMHYTDSEQIVLAAYHMFDGAPIRFEKSLVAQVNWGYDIGHNVP